MSFTPMKDLKGYMTPAECKKVVDAADNLRDTLLLRLLWRTGARISEVLSLELDDILYDDRVIIIKTLKRRKRKKGGKEKKRRIPIDIETLKMIKEFTDSKKIFKGTVFHITRVAAFYIVRKCGAKAGITHVGEKEIHPHHFRHSFAVEFIKKNPDSMRQLQMLLGHSSISTTAEYLQFSPTELREDYDRMWDEE